MIYVQFLYTYPSFWGVFRRGQDFIMFLLWHTDTKTKYPGQIYDKFSFPIKVEYSGKMELVATKILLTKLQKKVGIRILTTDRSS